MESNSSEPTLLGGDNGRLPPLAIIGMSYRLPKDTVNDQQLWKMLLERRCASEKTPQSRFNVDAHYHPDNHRSGATSIKNGHFITGDLGEWDAPFFNITASEAEAMDPAQRLTLETAFNALQNAGLSLESMAGSKTSVYSASFMRDYEDIQSMDPDIQAKHRGIASASSMLANRVSWFFDLKGPSGSVDTACSSSLLAVDLACQSIWAGDATMGLACGSNLMLVPSTTASLDSLGLLSRDGRCFSFDHRANGYARGEGFGVVVIKPVDAAIRNGDTIRAIIRSSCSNQDGKTPTISQPSQEAQERLIQDTYAKAGLDLSKTRYFEAHGTGTAVGDPIETNAIGNTFRSYRSLQDPLYVGSIKANIGHLEGAAGVAGIIKAVLVLESGIIPPQANFERLNAAIDAEFLNIKIPTTTTHWPSAGLRRASIQSFGIGGSNSHVILDDAYYFLQKRGLQGQHNTTPLPDLPPSLREPPTDSSLVNQVARLSSEINGKPNPAGEDYSTKVPYLLVWSMADESGLGRVAKAWKKYMDQLQLSPKDLTKFIKDLSHTLIARREHFLYRSYALIRRPEEVLSISDKISKYFQSTTNLKLGFVFSGQGSQWYAMGRELFCRYPVYRKSVVEAATFLKTLKCTWDAVEELMRDEESSNVDDAEFSQPLCSIVQVALVELLASFGIFPAKVIGHSSGEIAAAFCAGAISRTVAWKVAYFRGLVASGLIGTKEPNTEMSFQGGMMAVGLSKTVADEYIRTVEENMGCRRLVVACVNSPRNVTVSGDAVHLDHLKSLLDSDPGQIFSRKLKVPVAYHSFQMNAVADEYRSCLGDLGVGPDLRPKTGCIMISTVTGCTTNKAELSQPDYWVRNLTSPVLFSDAMMAAYKEASATSSGEVTLKLDGSHIQKLVITKWIEIGPHSVLQGPVRENLQQVGNEGRVEYLSSLVRRKPAVESILDLVGRLHCEGYPVKLELANQMDDEEGAGSGKVLTALPEYPFNHNKSYWFESRISKSYRFREFINNDLLGTPASDWNPMEARWRHVIKSSNLPWIDQHRINGSILYPAAGMIVMAIEAARQLADSSRSLSGFMLREISFQSALAITDTVHGVEVNLHMTHRKDESEKDAGWYDFRLYQHDPAILEHWTESCRGSIQILYENTQDTQGIELRRRDMDSSESQKWIASHLHRATTAKELCSNSFEPQKLYEQLLSSGYGYGPAFQGIGEISYDTKGLVVSKVQTDCWLPHTGAQRSQPLIHPTTLDTILHTAIAVFTHGGSREVPTSIPTFIDRMWISADGSLNTQDGNQVRVVTRASQVGHRQAQAELLVVDDKSRSVLINIEEFQTTSVVSNEEDKLNSQQAAKPCHTVDWKPDPTLLLSPELQQFCNDSVEEPKLPAEERYGDIDMLVTATIYRTLRALKGSSPLNGHRKKYFEWMKQRLSLAQNLPLPTRKNIEDPDFVDSLIEKMSTGNHEARFYAAVAQEHANLVVDDKPAVDLLFTGKLVSDYYRASSQTPGTARFCALLDVIAHQNPEMRILELGAGTGSLTDHMVKTLTTRGENSEISRTPRFHSFDYTDMSPYFFPEAQDKYAKLGSRLRCATLNIEQDPEVQGFEAGSYDLVVANGVLHATSNLLSTLANCRKLLKLGGKLVFAEVTNCDEGLRLNFPFGLLEGWWLGSEEYRKLNPSISASKWDELLRQSGFSGNDVVLPDYQHDIRHEYSIIMSTAVEHQGRTSIPETKPASIVLIHGADDVDQKSIAQRLQSRLEEGKIHRATVTTLSSITDRAVDDGELFVFLMELEKPTWQDIEEPVFDKLQTLLTADLERKSLWLCQKGSEGKDSSETEPAPAYSLIDGISRVLNSELDGPGLSVLKLQAEQGINEQHLSMILKVVERLVQQREDIPDTEYVEQDGQLLIPRMVQSESLNEAFSNRITPTKTVRRSWKEEDGVPLKLSLGTLGLLNTLHFVQDQELNEPLDASHVEIDIRAVGLNYRDVLIALGRLENANIGCECAGVITRIGSKTTGLQIGDRVVAVVPSGCFRSYVRVDHHFAAKIPSSMSFNAAAAMLVNHFTAWSAFHDICRISQGETVLVHSGAGGTGQAAIQVAKYMGAKVLATVGSLEKKNLLMNQYDLDEDCLFSSREPVEFSRGIARVTNGRGVDAVLNALNGESLSATWECMAPFGRFVEIGKKDIVQRKQLPMANFEKNVSFHAFDIGMVCTYRPETVRPSMEKIMKLHEEGHLSPAYPMKTCGVSELEKVFRTMQSGKTMGKMVVSMRTDERVEATIDTLPITKLSSTASYVIAGGLGGLGRTMAAWLVDRGAQNLILLSRSGPRSEEARQFVSQIRRKGVQVATPACDVSDYEALRSALGGCAKDMPPVKGAVQASMVLRDAAFSSMTYANWRAATRPKVQGSWNMHKLLPSNMDFFIGLSSAAGAAGGRGQANYAAGNTFIDALMRYRASRGQAGATLDLGVFLDVGFLTEDMKLRARWADHERTSVTEKDLLSLLDIYCSPTKSKVPFQAAFGIAGFVGGKSTNYFFKKPMLCTLVLEQQVDSIRDADVQKSERVNFISIFAHSSSVEEATAAVREAFLQKLASTLALPMEGFDPDTPLHAYGVDSLVAVELRNWFVKEVQADLAVFDLLGGATAKTASILAVAKTKMKKGNNLHNVSKK